ncbi:hypothetical protein A4X13_0g8415, partial [Tilletia indica]
SRAVRDSDGKTNSTGGKSISAAGEFGRAIGRLGRQDAGYGTTRSTARTDWVGKGCQGTFLFPQLERQDGGRLGHDEKVMIKRDLSRTACLGRRDEDLGRSRRSIIDVSPGGIRVGAMGVGSRPDTNRDGWAGASRQQTTDFVRRRRAFREKGPYGQRARAACNSDGKMNNTVGTSISPTLRAGRRDTRTWDGPGGRRSIMWPLEGVRDKLQGLTDHGSWRAKSQACPPVRKDQRPQPLKGGSGTVPQDPHDSGDGRRFGKRTDVLRRNEGQSRVGAVDRDQDPPPTEAAGSAR